MPQMTIERPFDNSIGATNSVAAIRIFTFLPLSAPIGVRHNFFETGWRGIPEEVEHH